MLSISHFGRLLLPALLLSLFAGAASAQTFRVQCPQTTTLHPNGSSLSSTSPGRVKCQQISGGDGFATMGDGTQTYLFAFGPLSGLKDMADGLPGTQLANVFNTPFPSDADVHDSSTWGTGAAANGAVGLVPDPNSVPPNQLNGHVDPRLIMDVGVLNGNMPAPLMAIEEDDEFFLTLTNVGQIMRPDLFE